MQLLVTNSLIKKDPLTSSQMTDSRTLKYVVKHQSLILFMKKHSTSLLIRFKFNTLRNQSLSG